MQTLTLSLFIIATLGALGTWLAPRIAESRRNRAAEPAIDSEGQLADSAQEESAPDLRYLHGLAVWWRELNKVRVLSLFGKVGRYSSHDLRNTLKAEAASDAVKPLVVDLTGVTRIDEPGWTAILWARDKLSERNRPLRVLMAVGSQPYSSYFRCGVDTVLPKLQILNETPSSE